MTDADQTETTLRDIPEASFLNSSNQLLGRREEHLALTSGSPLSRKSTPRMSCMWSSTAASEIGAAHAIFHDGQCDYRALYKTTYKAYVESVFEKDENRAIISQLQLQRIENRPCWLQQQVQEAVTLLQRWKLQLETSFDHTQSPPNHTCTPCSSSSVEQMRRCMDRTTSPSISNTSMQVSNSITRHLARRNSSHRRTWRKRMATTSGKKGRNHKKIHWNTTDSFSGDWDALDKHDQWVEDLDPQGDTESFPYSFPNHELSPNLLPDTPVRHSFISNVSPIPQQDISCKLTKSPMSPIDWDIHHVDDTIQSPDCTILPRKTRWMKSHVQSNELQRTDKAPSNLMMQKGSVFHLHPLRVQRQQQQQPKRHHDHHQAHNDHPPPHHQQQQQHVDPKQKSHTQNTPLHQDYFTQHGPRLAAILHTASKWLLSQDRISPTAAIPASRSDSIQQTTLKRAALIINTTQSQTSSLILHMLIKNGTHKTRPSSSISMIPLSNNSNILGGTLIVVRAKEDLILWERIFREQSSYSILNHAAIPAKVRRSVSETAAKCSQFNIVLTTFDSIKNKEIPISVDNKGRAIHPHSNGRWTGTSQQSSQPWYSTRHGHGTEMKRNNTEKENQSQHSNDEDELFNKSYPVVKVRSVLHGIRWHRLVFVDSLENSFMIRDGSRSEAAISLHGSSRILFLMHNDQCTETNDHASGIKESRKQLLSIASVLDLNPKTAAQDVVGRYMLDLYNLIRQ